MNPVRIEGAHGMIGNAEDGLPVRIENTEQGPCRSSAWQPSPDELKHLLAGQPVVLSVFGPGDHPFVWLRVEEPPVKLIVPGRLS